MNESMYKEHYEVQGKHWWFKAKKQIVMSQLSPKLPAIGKPTILDAGCGCGLMLQELSKVGNVSGMDFSEEAISFSQKHFHGPLKKGVLPDTIPFEKESFNMLVALDVVEHIDDDVGALKSLQGLLKTNGVAVLTVPANMSLWSHHDVMNEHKRRYTLPEFKSKIETAGFKIESISYYNTFLFPLVYIQRKVSQLLKLQSEDDLKVPSKLMNFILYRVFVLEKFFLKFMKFPFGVSVIAIARKADR